MESLDRSKAIIALGKRIVGVDEADELRFFSRAPRDEEFAGASEEERRLLEFAIGIDYSSGTFSVARHSGRPML